MAPSGCEKLRACGIGKSRKVAFSPKPSQPHGGGVCGSSAQPEPGLSQQQSAASSHHRQVVPLVCAESLKRISSVAFSPA